MIVFNRREILRQILEEMAEHKRQAEAEALRRRDEIAQSAPLYANIEQELARIRMQLSKEALAHPGTQAQLDEEARRRVLELRDRAREQLRLAGYTQEDLRPAYICSVCRDTGAVGEEGRQTRCECVTKQLHRRLYALGGAQGHSFETFDPTVFPDEPETPGLPSQRERMCKARDYALSFAQRFPQTEKTNLLLMGPSGLGKTFLLDCISLRVLERGFTVIRATAFQMFECMRSYHRGQDDGGFSAMLKAQFVAIDDLGTEPMMANITQEYFFTLLSERKARGLSTVLATNLDLRALLERYGERSISRMADKTDTAVLAFSGKDLRRGR